MQRHNLRDNNRGPIKDTRRPNTSNCTPDNKSRGSWCCTTNSGSDLEDEHRDQEDEFRAVEGVDPAPEELGCAAG